MIYLEGKSAGNWEQGDHEAEEINTTNLSVSTRTSRFGLPRHFPTPDLPFPSLPPSRESRTLSSTILASHQRRVGMWCVMRVVRSLC